MLKSFFDSPELRRTSRDVGEGGIRLFFSVLGTVAKTIIETLKSTIGLFFGR